MRWEGARLVSVGIGFADGEAQGILDALAETLDLNLFVGLGGQRRVAAISQGAAHRFG